MPFIRINVTVPKEIFNSEKMINAIRTKMATKTGLDLGGQFLKTVRTWDKPPGFARDLKQGTDYISMQVYPYGPYADKYALVNLGSPSHSIRPRRAKLLRFQTGYAAKSRPRLIGSFAGGKFGDFVTAGMVNHPGFTAREFDAEIAEQYYDTFAADIQKAISESQ